MQVREVQKSIWKRMKRPCLTSAPSIGGYLRLKGQWGLREAILRGDQLSYPCSCLAFEACRVFESSFQRPRQGCVLVTSSEKFSPRRCVQLYYCGEVVRQGLGAEVESGNALCLCLILQLRGGT